MATKNVTIALPEHLWKKARNFADRQGKSLSFVLREMLENFFDENTQLQQAHEKIRQIAKKHRGEMQSWKREDLYEI